MAKKYVFRFNAQKADFSTTGMVGVAYGSNCLLKEDERELTLAEAIIYLDQFADSVKKPCACFCTVKRGQRTPPGFKQAVTTVYRVA